MQLIIIINFNLVSSRKLLLIFALKKKENQQPTIIGKYHHMFCPNTYVNMELIFGTSLYKTSTLEKFLILLEMIEFLSSKDPLKSCFPFFLSISYYLDLAFCFQITKIIKHYLNYHLIHLNFFNYPN